MRAATLILLAVLVGLPARSWSEPFTWRYVAVPVLESYPLYGISLIGVPLTGYATFESSVPDVDADPGFGLFEGATVGGYLLVEPPFVSQPMVIFEAGPSAVGQVVVNLGEGLPASIFAAIQYEDYPDDFPFFESSVGSLELVDSSKSAFATDSLPLRPPDLSSLDPFDPEQAEALGFTTRLLILANGRAGGLPDYRLEAYVTQLVPEPSALPLTAMGVGISIGVQRRRQKRAAAAST
jgi:hypothetical protein